MKEPETTISNNITGALGKPLGTIVEIEGQLDTGERSKAEMDKKMFRVLKVDGEEPSRAVVLPLETFSWMPAAVPGEGESVKYIGYETGGMTGIPEKAFRYMPYVATEAFGFSSYFQIIKKVD